MFPVTSRNNLFKRFYNTDVTVVQIKKDDYSGEMEKKSLNSFKADVQPYSGGKAYEKYGAQIECQFRMFCNTEDNIEVKNHVEISGEIYEITYIARWDMGLEVMLKRSSLR